MFRTTLRTSVQTFFTQNTVIIFGLIVINLLFNIIANVVLSYPLAYRISAASYIGK